MQIDAHIHLYINVMRIFKERSCSCKPLLCIKHSQRLVAFLNTYHPGLLSFRHLITPDLSQVMGQLVTVICVRSWNTTVLITAELPIFLAVDIIYLVMQPEIILRFAGAMQWLT